MTCVGLFGGTFDPPHVGHIVAAAAVRYELGCERVDLVVANDPWQKRDVRSVTSSEIRLEMTRAAVTGAAALRVSDEEIGRGGPSYTIDTVRRRLAVDPDEELVVVVGADAAAGLDTWHEATELATLVRIAVVARENVAVAAPSRWNVTAVPMTRLDVSSSDIRARVAAGRPISGLVAPATEALIGTHGLYR